MPLCSNGQKPIIKWQYPGEDLNQILGADNYSIGMVKGQCNTSYLVKGMYASNSMNYCQTPLINTNWQLNVPGKVHGIASRYFRTDDRYSCPNFTRIVGKIDVYQAYLSHGSNPSNFALDVTYFADHTTAGSVVTITDIIRTDGQPDNCGGCALKIFKGSQTVYSRVEPTCPTVTYACGDECPPGTCQCDCGSMVCCYDTKTGKAVKSFRK